MCVARLSCPKQRRFSFQSVAVDRGAFLKIRPPSLWGTQLLLQRNITPPYEQHFKIAWPTCLWIKAQLISPNLLKAAEPPQSFGTKCTQTHRPKRSRRFSFTFSRNLAWRVGSIRSLETPPFFIGSKPHALARGVGTLP